MSDEDPLDAHVALGWRALSPPADSMARVRARLLGDPGPGPDGSTSGGASPSGRVQRSGAVALGHDTLWAERWLALRASSVLGWAVGAALLALGFGIGIMVRPTADAIDARSAAPLVSVSDAPRGEVLPLHPPLAPPGAVAPAAVVETHGATVAHGSRETEHELATDGASGPSPRANAPVPGDGQRRLESKPSRPRAPRLPARGSGDADELRVLERAERALRSDNPELGLVLLRALDESRPSSGLLEERRALELMALCQTAAPESAARSADFTRRYASSVYAARIANECSRSTNPDALDMNRGQGDFHVKP